MIDASQIAVDFIEDLKLENAQLRANVAELDQRLLESNQAYLDRLVIVEAENRTLVPLTIIFIRSTIIL